MKTAVDALQRYRLAYRLYRKVRDDFQRCGVAKQRGTEPRLFKERHHLLGAGAGGTNPLESDCALGGFWEEENLCAVSKKSGYKVAKRSAGATKNPSRRRLIKVEGLYAFQTSHYPIERLASHQA
ncbi:MAG: hypothetical protein K6U12_13340, partial [Armatimonadetes bacterium]|nr:hypothetical protein [Armatimonadota bacterium]